jgi:hypothetical protein
VRAPARRFSETLQLSGPDLPEFPAAQEPGDDLTDDHDPTGTGWSGWAPPRADPATEGTALERLARLAVQRITAATAASISTLRQGRFATIAATDGRVRRADAVQYDLARGPAVDALLGDELFHHATDLRHDPRWAEAGGRIADGPGYGGLLSFRLSLDLAADDQRAALNIYATAPDAFDARDLGLGLLLASHGGLALAAATNRDRALQLERALHTNRDIGVAMGILMSRYRLPRTAAFDLLRISSQRLNRKINDLALDIIDIGELPEVPTGEHGPPL